ncbi:MAG: putative Ig domain-containing protein, partial [Fibrobacteria bacterium]
MLSPIIRKSLLAAASCTLLASCLLGTQSKRGSVVDNELRVGTIYAANGDPAANARVRVYPVGHLPDTVADTAGSAGNQDVYATRTDGKGQYKIGELPQGEYNILADQAGQYAIQDSVYLDEKTATLASDTLDEPGSLVGVVGMQPNHDPRFALVQVLGTYNYANVDAFGRFTLAALAEGKYTLRVFTSLTDYNTLFKSITILAGKQDTLRDTLVLPYLGIPVVTGLKATFDTLHSIVSLSWDSAAYRDFSQYQVYRDAQPVLDATKIPVGTTTDTTFHDNLVGILGGGGSAPITTPATYEYRIRIKSKSDQIGLSYGNAAIRTPPPTLVQTDIALQVKSIKWDSIIQADSIEVSATLRNPTRKLVSLVWTVGAGADSVRNSLAMDSLGATLFAERTLKFGWKAEGALLVGVTVTDDAGTAWTKNLTLQGNTAPSMTGTPDSTAKAYETYIFTPLVSDPDHDALRFSIANAPAWATFDSLTGVLSGTPTNADSGTDSGIVISVTDGRRRAESDAFQVRIVATPWIPGAKSPRNINTVLVSAVAAGGKIFLLGDNLLAYDPVSAIWTTEAQIPFLPTFTAAIGEKIFCINVWGPADDRFGPLQENYMYDVVSRVWEKKSP